MSKPYSIDAMHSMRTRVWATRDGCMDHYPRYCPPGCPNAGKHDAGLAELGACECHRCRKPWTEEQLQNAAEFLDGDTS